MAEPDFGPGVAVCRSRSLASRYWGISLAMLVAFSCLQTAFAQLRIVNYNIAHQLGDPAAMQQVFASLHADDKDGFAVPVSVFVFQEVQSANLVPLLNLVNASAPPGVTYVAATYTNNSEDDFGGAQAMFYRSGMLQEFAASHADIYTQAGRYTDRWRLQMPAYSSITSWFYIYGSHLKSDTGPDNENERLLGVNAIRGNADALGSGLNIIYCGDLNFYNNSEPGYLKYLSVGSGQAIDPLGSGPWNGMANAIKHSQSPRLVNIDGLVGGGMDDRFDFQFSSAALNDGAGVARMSGTYRGLGNDALHYNLAINNGDNFYYPGNVPLSNLLANHLHDASDHIPIVVDYQLPAVMAGSIAANYGKVIQGASYSIPIQVTNAANVVIVDGADELDYTAVASLGLSGSFSDTVLPLGDTSTPNFALNTSLVGPRNGKVTLTSTSQSVQNPSIILNTTGTIVRHASASFSSSSIVNRLTVPAEFDSDTGVHTVFVDVHNFGYDAMQALLDIDSVNGASSPFAFTGGAPASGIGSAPATLQFTIDTTGLKQGTYVAPISVNTSDENIPGASAAILNLTISVIIDNAPPCIADVNGDLSVNVDDLLAVIGAWGPCADPEACPGDTNADDVVDVDDLLAVIGAWGACP